jgi:putative transposase
VATEQEKDERRRLERAREIALFRYSLIQDVIGPHLTAAQRGQRVRGLAAMTHPGPGGTQVRVSYQTINRWKRDYLGGGFDALVPAPRQASPRTPGEVLTLAAALKRENPERTAAQVQRILRAQSGWAPSDRTLQRLFGRLELGRPAGQDSELAFGRFEASRPNELWTGDALHGPVIAGRKAYLFCFVDDHSRAVMGARWAFHEDVVRLAASRMPQLLTQITGYLGRALAAGRLGHDLGEDPAHAIGAAVVFLGDARGSAAALAGDLDAAWQQLSLINGHPVPRASKDRS